MKSCGGLKPSAAPEGVVVESDGDLGDFLQQLLEERAIEDPVVVGQHALPTLLLSGRASR